MDRKICKIIIEGTDELTIVAKIIRSLLLAFSYLSSLLPTERYLVSEIGLMIPIHMQHLSSFIITVFE